MAILLAAYPSREGHANVAYCDGKRGFAMRSLLITAVAATAAVVLAGCPKKKPEPVPGPQSAPAHSRATATSARHDAARDDHGVSEISWFQGTLEEAFSRRTCPEHRRLL